MACWAANVGVGAGLKKVAISGGLSSRNRCREFRHELGPGNNNRVDSYSVLSGVVHVHNKLDHFLPFTGPSMPISQGDRAGGSIGAPLKERLR
jgi:hypothetical protein